MKSQPVKASDYVAQFLVDRGITHVFEVIGGMVTHLLDSCHRNGRVAIIPMHHEQSAAFAAEGYARMTGVPGVAVATSGPGAVNLLTGIGSCYFDSVPSLFITGQVNRNELKGERSIRQLGFQETDIVSMARPVCKAAIQILDPHDLPRQMQRAFALTRAGRAGPVLIDIPMDVQHSLIDDTTQALSPPLPQADPADLEAQVRCLMGAWQRARRPLILAGGGLRTARVVDQFRQIVRGVNMPVVYSLMGVDALPHGDACRVGLIGTYANRWANMALGAADFLLVLGSRLDVRQTGADVAAFQGSRTVYHVDVDPGEINNRVKGCVGITSDLGPFLQAVQRQLADGLAPQCPAAWLKQIAAWRTRFPDTAELMGSDNLNPNVFMHLLSQNSKLATAFVVDVGQHQMWAAQSVEVEASQRFLTSGGMGAMGFALPAAIGVAFACPGRPVVCLAGDGGFQMNIQELQTVVHHGLPIKIVVINNRSLGLVRQFQQDYFDGRYQSTVVGYSAPDFAAVARSYGIEASTVTQFAEVRSGIAELWRQPDKPFLLQVMLDPGTNVHPKMAFGRPVTDMEPSVDLAMG